MANQQDLQQYSMKKPVVTGFQSMEVNEVNDEDEVKGTRYDMTEMDRMGKAQQFKVSAISITCKLSILC